MIYNSDQINELAAALSAAQKEISNPLKEAKNPFFKSVYADLPAVLNVIRDVLPNHGLSFSQTIEIHSDKVFLATLLMHKSGQWIKSYAPILCKDPNDPQKFGSSLTYFRRYALQAIVGIVGDDDDDGNKANIPEKKKKLSLAQLDEIHKRCDDDALKLVEAMARKAGFMTLQDVHEERYEGILKYIDSIKGKA